MLPTGSSHCCPSFGDNLSAPATRTAAPLPAPLAASHAAGSSLSFSRTSWRLAWHEPSLIDMKQSFFCDRLVLTQPHTTTSLPSASGLALSSVATATRDEYRSLGSSAPPAAPPAATAAAGAPPPPPAPRNLPDSVLAFLACLLVSSDEEVCLDNLLSIHDTTLPQVLLVPTQVCVCSTRKCNPGRAYVSRGDARETRADGGRRRRPEDTHAGKESMCPFQPLRHAATPGNRRSWRHERLASLGDIKLGLGPGGLEG
mmetsp:Transcript_5010/g.16698  ORF Transcript_5010/g.16698 Transcript_5010/m.16698 type:complete len:257 (-) Transcript_5010:438-1208(-)